MMLSMKNKPKNAKKNLNSETVKSKQVKKPLMMLKKETTDVFLKEEEPKQLWLLPKKT